MTPPIPAFDFRTLHEVVGFGRILPPLGETNEYGIQIFFAEVVSELTYTLGLEMETRRAGCGQLGWIPIGSRWKAGAFKGQRIGRRQHVGKLSYRGQGTLGAFLDRPANSGFALARDMTCHLMKVQSADPGLTWVVVPAAEIIRVLFGVSTQFLVQLFGGLDDADLAPDSAFYNRPMSLPLPDESFRLACTREVSDMEAIMAAWVLSDPVMLKAHDSVDRHRDIGADNDGTSPIGMDCPEPAFVGPWTFEGAVVPSLTEVNGLAVKPKRTFLVSRILAIPLTPPFKRLEITHHRVQRTEGGPPSGARINTPRAKPIPRLQETKPAGTGHAPIAEAMDGAVLEPAHAIEILRILAPSGGSPPPLTLMGKDLRDAEKDASTGDRQPGGGAAHVIGRRRRDLLEHFNGTDDRVESRQATWLAAFDLAITEGWGLAHGGVDEDDSVHLETALVGKVSFPVLVVCLSTKHGDVIVADAGTAEGEGSSLGLAIRKDRRPFVADRDLPQILSFAAKTGAHWKTKAKTLDGFAVHGVGRLPSGIWKKRTEYRDLVRGGIVEVFSLVGVAIPPVTP